jgi:hypothetical protein
MYQDYKDLLSAFHAHGVKYLVVGAYAVIFHAQPRFTKDLDLFIKADPGNAQATYDALAEFGAPLQGIRPKEFADRANFFRFGRSRDQRRDTEANQGKPRRQGRAVRQSIKSVRIDRVEATAALGLS